MSKEGKDWQAVKRTSTLSDKHNPQMVVNGNKIYYTWHEADGPNWRKARYQIWTAHMNVDGTGWEATQKTFTPFDKYPPNYRSIISGVSAYDIETLKMYPMSMSSGSSKSSIV